MNREPIINHLASVVNAVLLADDKLRPEWQERLQQTRDADADTREQTARQYIRAVAEELLNSYSDDELKEMYHELSEE